MNIDVSVFSKDQAGILLHLITRAFQSIPIGARPQETVESILHFNGVDNPAGPSICATAYERNTPIGIVTAMPMRFSSMTGYQVGGFFVDESHQGQGIGKQLLLEITSTLRKNSSSFVYTFPNSRSIGVFYKLGYVLSEKIPTYIIPNYMFSSKTTIPRTAINYSLLRPELFKGQTSNGIIKDELFFNWRYCNSFNKENYKFVLKKINDKILSICVLRKHKFKGVNFNVLVDIFATTKPEFTNAIFECRKLGKPLYINAKIPRSYLPLLTLQVPDRFNPRPLHLLIYPNDLNTDLRYRGIMTGDWFGF